jgi:hypothetical protein
VLGDAAQLAALGLVSAMRMPAEDAAELAG